jgi:butyryl-CoA dehydrogenase
MFQMMNETRIEVGMGAAAMATAAYYASLAYAQERRQGRKVSEKDLTRPQIPIIEHADVKRMLLFQRSVVEGSLSLGLQCSRYVDMQKICDPPDKERYQLLLEILTPVAKTYPSEMGILSISQGLQCFGGSGYCDDYPLEQYYRDARIHPIHEGTTGIHGIDLLGRKVTMLHGKALAYYQEEVEGTVEESKKHAGLERYGQKLFEALEELRAVTQHLLGIAKDKGADFFLADATSYLEFFSIIAIAWQWLLQAIAIQNGLEKELSEGEDNFYKGKLCAFRYFFNYELPKIEVLAERLRTGDGLTVAMKAEWFSD